MKNKLSVLYSKVKKDIVFKAPLGVETNDDIVFLNRLINRTFLSELRSRGYDVKTLRFEIKVNPASKPSKFRSLLRKHHQEWEEVSKIPVGTLVQFTCSRVTKGNPIKAYWVSQDEHWITVKLCHDVSSKVAAWKKGENRVFRKEYISIPKPIE